MKRIEETRLLEYFDGYDYSSIVMLDEQESRAFWYKYVDNSAGHYFKLKDDSWLVRSNRSTIAEWETDFKNKQIGKIMSALDARIDWDDNYTIYFCVHRSLVLSTNWGTFKRNWIAFLYCSDECPVIISESSPNQAIVLSPGGEIWFIDGTK